jgi:hypothetical protein
MLKLGGMVGTALRANSDRFEAVCPVWGKGRRKARLSALDQIADIGVSRLSCKFLDPVKSRGYGLHKI